MTSSTKNGLPSALVKIGWRMLSGSDSIPSKLLTSFLLSLSANGARYNRIAPTPDTVSASVTILQPGASVSGRVTKTVTSGASALTGNTSKPSSTDETSAQCISSQTMI